VIPPVARAAALLVLAPFLTFASALAPQHVHEPEPGHDDEHAVAHSHFELHQAGLRATDHARPTTEQDIDHDDEPVVWLDGSTLHEAPYQLDATPRAILGGYETVRIERHWTATPFDAAAPVHGPPRPASPFRGPPLEG